MRFPRSVDSRLPDPGGTAANLVRVGPVLQYLRGWHLRDRPAPFGDGAIWPSDSWQGSPDSSRDSRVGPLPSGTEPFGHPILCQGPFDSACLSTRFPARMVLQYLRDRPARDPAPTRSAMNRTDPGRIFDTGRFGQKSIFGDIFFLKSIVVPCRFRICSSFTPARATFGERRDLAHPS